MRTAYEPVDKSDLPAFETQREMEASVETLYRAWTNGFGTWFAVPDSVIMKPRVDTAYFFETEHEGQRHPHHGRFLQLEKDRVVSMTWTNAALQGAETVLTVELERNGSGALLKLRHHGFPDEELRDQTGEAWEQALMEQDRDVSEGNTQ